MTTLFTKEETGKAYENLIWAQGLVNYVLRTGANLKEGESISIFSILEKLLEGVEPVMEDLEYAPKDCFLLLQEEEKSKNENNEVEK
jgi:hypothetical protein